MTAIKPTPKVAAAGAAGAVVTVLVWAAGLAGVDVPPEVAAALAVLVAFAGGWLRRDTRTLIGGLSPTKLGELFRDPLMPGGPLDTGGTPLNTGGPIPRGGAYVVGEGSRRADHVNDDDTDTANGDHPRLPGVQ